MVELLTLAFIKGLATYLGGGILKIGNNYYFLSLISISKNTTIEGPCIIRRDSDLTLSEIFPVDIESYNRLFNLLNS